jgi:dihydroneopterin aldolase
MEISEVSLQVHLGVSETERAVAQEVRLSMDLYWAEAPVACQTDKIEDALCYATLIASCQDIVENTSFATIEHLAHRFYQRLREVVPPTVRPVLRLHKVRPPVEGLRGGVFIELG